MKESVKKLFGSSEEKILVLSPIEGKTRPLSEVNDSAFSMEILGKGIAIEPDKGRVVAPVNGIVALMFKTKHAVSIVSEQGIELLIHIGLDTVKLNGEYFKSYVESGDKIRVGDLLIEFEIDKLKEAGYDLVSPLIVCNYRNYCKFNTVVDKKVLELDTVITLKE